MPGLVQRAVDPKGFWPGWTRLYQLAWFFGCLVSGIVYLVLDHFWPMPEKLAVDDLDYFGTFGEPPIVTDALGVDADCKDIVMHAKAIDV